MLRSTFLGAVLLCFAAEAGSASNLKAAGKAAEAKEIADGFVSSSTPGMSIGNACSRIKFLGQEALASRIWGGAVGPGVSTERRRTLAEGLSILAHPDGSEGLARALSDEDGAVRMYAAQGLGRMKVREAAPRVAALLGDKTLGARREAAKALGIFHDTRFCGALVKAAKAEDDAETRAAMLVAVGQCGDKKQARALEPYLTGPSETAQFAAAQGLVLLGAAPGLKFAAQKLASKDRTEVLQGLTLFEGARAKEVAKELEPLLKHPDRTVQATAARILYQGGDAKKLDWLVLESFKASGEDRLPYETQLETLRLTDEERKAILKRAGIQ